MKKTNAPRTYEDASKEPPQVFHWALDPLGTSSVMVTLLGVGVRVGIEVVDVGAVVVVVVDDGGAGGGET